MANEDPTKFITKDDLHEFYTNILPYLGGKPNAGYTPVGTIITVTGLTAPENYVVCDGTIYEIARFPYLAEYFETQFGSSNHFGGNGTTTFAVPNVTASPGEVVTCIATENIYIGLDDERPVQAAMDRWLRFDPTNKKGLIIKAGTSILKSDKAYVHYKYDTKIDLSTYITGSDNGKDFFVYLLDDGSIVASTSQLSVGVKIGRFHTLCADAGSSLTMIAPASPSSGMVVGGGYLVKPYLVDSDPDFYAFYNKTITAVSVGTPYDVITCEHPLKGFSAGDILPESVFCSTFYPECLVEDAMVYDKTTNICVDIYLQSGTGFNTRSAYNATHTVSRQSVNHLADMLTVGKKLLSDPEFTSIALGSNECTVIQGSSDKTAVGGHVDTNGRRMISAIGCEECCGYLWQWLREIAKDAGTASTVTDGIGAFGQDFGEPYIMLAGGRWSNSSSCGSRARNCLNLRSAVVDFYGGRGCTNIIRSANAAKGSAGLSMKEHYSTDEHIVGTWIDGKTVYERVFELTTGSSAGWYSASGQIQNIALCIKLDGVIGTNTIYYSPGATPGEQFIVALESGVPKVYVSGTNLLSKPVKIIVQYTKNN